MPLIYVHGIGNRIGDRYNAAERERNALFRRFLGEHSSPILSPYWGDDVIRPARLHAALPVSEMDRLGGAGSGGDMIDAIRLAGVHGSRALVTVAQSSVPDAVDLLFSVSPAGAPEENADLAERVVRYCELRESLHPDEPPLDQYPWLAEAADDFAFVTGLFAAIGDAGASPAGLERLGGKPGRERFAEGVRWLRHTLADRQIAPVADRVRRAVAPRMVDLAADVLGYLTHRGTPETPGPVIEVVAAAFDQAKAHDGPLVVVAHSLGGAIVHDLLASFRPDLNVDVLVTVGSQVGLLQELGLLTGQHAEQGRPNVSCWLNVVDLADLLSFRVAPIFDGAVDYVYPSGALWAHTAYLRQPHFHARLAGRVRAAPAVSRA